MMRSLGVRERLVTTEDSLRTAILLIFLLTAKERVKQWGVAALPGLTSAREIERCCLGLLPYRDGIAFRREVDYFKTRRWLIYRAKGGKDNGVESRGNDAAGADNSGRVGW